MACVFTQTPGVAGHDRQLLHSHRARAGIVSTRKRDLNFTLEQDTGESFIALLFDD
jgi:hypothetical protein